MSVRIVPDDAIGRAEAIDALRHGALIGLPTDTVYGIAVALDVPDAIDRLFAAKSRPPDRAIMVLVDSLDQVAGLVEVTESARVLAEAFWPGGLTLVLPVRAGAGIPAGLTAGGGSLGVRVPDHPTPRALARAIGPLPTTSANRSGEPAANVAGDVLAALGDALDVVIDGGPSPGGIASTVIDCAAVRPRLIRSGAIIPRRLAAALEARGLPHELPDV